MVETLITNYKELPPEDELKLVLLLSFLADSIKDAQLQTFRWKRSKRHWDITALFLAISQIEDIRGGLKRYLQVDENLWGIFKEFNKNYRALKINDIRNNLIHRLRAINWQDKDGNSLPLNAVRIYGGCLNDNVYYFAGQNFILKDIFELVKNLKNDLLSNYRIKLMEGSKYEGIVPWENLMDLE